jgi:hypothetical protein
MEALKGKGSERERTEIRMEAKNISVEKDIYHVNNIHLKADEKTGQISVGGNLMGDCSGGVVMVASKVSVDGNINERGARTGNITAANSISVKGDMNYQSNNVSLQAGEIFVGKDATFVNHDGEDTNIVVTNSISAKGSMKLAGDNASLKAKTVSVGKDMTFEGHSGGVDVVAEDLISADENMKLLGSRNTNGNVFLHAGKVFVGKDMTLEGRSGGVDVVAKDLISVEGNMKLLGGKNTNGNTSLIADFVFVDGNMTLEGRSGRASVVAEDSISVKGNMKLLGGNGNDGGVTLRSNTLVVGNMIGNANKKNTANITLTKRNGALNFDVKDLIVNENCHAKISLDGTEAWNRATGDSSTGVHFQKLTLRSGSTFDGIRTANNARHTSFNTYIFQGKDITFEGDFSGSGKLLNFQMPADIGNAPMVTVTGGAFLKGSRINVAIDGGTPILSEGSRIILMKANTMETQDIPLTSDASPDSLFTDGDGKRLSTGAATQGETKQDNVSTVDSIYNAATNVANSLKNTAGNAANGLKNFIGGNNGTSETGTGETETQPNGNNGTSANYANESLANYSNESLITETDGTQSGTAQDHILSINNAGTSSGSKGPEITVMQGVTMQYPYSLSVDGGALSMEIAGNPTLAPHTKAFSEGAIAAVGAVNRAIDFVADAGIQNFMEQGRIFTAFSGGMSRYQSGSHVDANEFAALIGCGKRFETSMGKFTAATFCEGVFGNYKTHNTFAGIGDVTGGGDTKGFGGGIFYRFDLHGSEKGHLYGEGTAHVGKVSYNFGSSDIADAAGRKATYSSESTYYGFHGSVGYMGAISDNAHWDLYGKYFLTHKKGKDATLSTGEKISFKDANSQRAVAGLKLARFVGNTTKVYLGGAYSYEFAGKINAQIQSLDVEAPSLRGSTEILEVGIANRWNDNFIDLAIQGYVGKRSGVSATIYLEHSF